MLSECTLQDRDSVGARLMSMHAVRRHPPRHTLQCQLCWVPTVRARCWRESERAVCCPNAHSSMPVMLGANSADKALEGARMSWTVLAQNSYVGANSSDKVMEGAGLSWTVLDQNMLSSPAVNPRTQPPWFPLLPPSAHHPSRPVAHQTSHSLPHTTPTLQGAHTRNLTPIQTNCHLHRAH